jgi:hypothetical protein
VEKAGMHSETDDTGCTNQDGPGEQDDMVDRTAVLTDFIVADMAQLRIQVRQAGRTGTLE